MLFLYPYQKVKQPVLGAMHLTFCPEQLKNQSQWNLLNYEQFGLKHNFQRIHLQSEHSQSHF